jgi:hypothetical protein
MLVLFVAAVVASRPLGAGAVPGSNRAAFSLVRADTPIAETTPTSGPAARAALAGASGTRAVLVVSVAARARLAGWEQARCRRAAVWHVLAFVPRVLADWGANFDYWTEGLLSPAIGNPLTR